MRAIQLNFTGNGAFFNFETPIDGFTSTVQNCLVNIGQKSKTDIIYPKKGSIVHTNAVQGGLTSPDLLETALFELSTETQDFVQDTEDDEFNEDKLSALEIELQIWESDKARVEVTATSSKGEVVGKTSEI